MTPSPFSRLASATVAGLVSTLAQTFAGVKTFAATIIASAGVQLSALWNTNGTGASDVGVKLGVSTADASVNAAARLAQWSTGIGGTEVAKLWVLKSGQISGAFAGGDAVSLRGNVYLGDGFGYVTTVSGALSVSNWTILGNGVAIGGVAQLNTTGTARPTASAAVRGSLWYSKSASGAVDTIEVCLKSAADTYSWVTIATG